MILITGGTGTSGSAIVTALLAMDAPVRVMARDPQKAARHLGDRVEIARGDFDDSASLDAALEDCDHALLLTTPSQRMGEQETSFINAAKRAGVKHLVKFSVYGVDANSSRFFPRTHGRVEDELRSSGLRWTMLRPTFFMQNFLAWPG
jgi:uncharacterized protein YbjT (DUF2867 family)